MRRLRIIDVWIFFAAAFLLLVQVVHAADAARTGPDSQAVALRGGPPPLEYFVRTLGISAEQQQRLKPVLDASRTKAEADMKAASAPGAQRPAADQISAAIRTRQADLREGLAKVLTPQQLAKYDQLNAEGPPPGQPGEFRDPHGHHETMTPDTAK